MIEAQALEKPKSIRLPVLHKTKFSNTNIGLCRPVITPEPCSMEPIEKTNGKQADNFTQDKAPINDNSHCSLDVKGPVSLKEVFLEPELLDSLNALATGSVNRLPLTLTQRINQQFGSRTIYHAIVRALEMGILDSAQIAGGLDLDKFGDLSSSNTPGFLILNKLVRQDKTLGEITDILGINFVNATRHISKIAEILTVKTRRVGVYTNIGRLAALYYVYTTGRSNGEAHGTPLDNYLPLLDPRNFRCRFMGPGGTCLNPDLNCLTTYLIYPGGENQLKYCRPALNYYNSSTIRELPEQFEGMLNQQVFCPGYEVKPHQGPRNNPLSRREIASLEALARGFSQREAAIYQGIHLNVLYCALYNVTAKLYCSSVIAAILRAREQNYFDPNTIYRGVNPYKFQQIGELDDPDNPYFNILRTVCDDPNFDDSLGYIASKLNKSVRTIANELGVVYQALGVYNLIKAALTFWEYRSPPLHFQRDSRAELTSNSNSKGKDRQHHAFLTKKTTSKRFDCINLGGNLECLINPGNFYRYHSQIPRGSVLVRRAVDKETKRPKFICRPAEDNLNNPQLQDKSAHNQRFCVAYTPIPFKPVTLTHLEILTYLAKGFSQPIIAERFSINRRWGVNKFLDKLGWGTQSQAVLHALDEGYIDYRSILDGFDLSIFGSERLKAVNYINILDGMIYENGIYETNSDLARHLGYRSLMSFRNELQKIYQLLGFTNDNGVEAKVRLGALYYAWSHFVKLAQPSKVFRPTSQVQLDALVLLGKGQSREEVSTNLAVRVEVLNDELDQLSDKPDIYKVIRGLKMSFLDPNKFARGFNLAEFEKRELQIHPARQVLDILVQTEGMANTIEGLARRMGRTARVTRGYIRELSILTGLPQNLTTLGAYYYIYSQMLPDSIN